MAGWVHSKHEFKHTLHHVERILSNVSAALISWPAWMCPAAPIFAHPCLRILAFVRAPGSQHLVCGWPKTSEDHSVFIGAFLRRFRKSTELGYLSKTMSIIIFDAVAGEHGSFQSAGYRA